MQVLWAPWRMGYVTASKEPGCIFCAASETADRHGSLVFIQRPAVVMLNKFPYVNGHLMVAPRRHAADPGTLPAEEFRLLMDVVQRVVTVLTGALRPDGMNIGMNLGAAAGAGVADHLHWHLVPRWIGDTNFMPMLAEVRVVPEHLEATYERLRPVLEPLSVA
jgi:ATP adenylyltransferase